MLRILERRPATATVISLVALFVALGGTGYAAFAVPRNSVGSPQVINGSLQKADLSKRTVAALKGNRGPRGFAGTAGAQGTAGATGPQGPAGATGPIGATGPQGIQGVPGPTTAWSAYAYPNASLPSTGGQVAHLTFTSAQAGVAVVTAHFGLRVRNNFTTTLADCRAQVQIAAAPGAPSETGPGFADQWINGNLPTEQGGGTYLQLANSTARVLPIVAGSNTVYLNGKTDCAQVLIGPVTMIATLADSGQAATLAFP